MGEDDEHVVCAVKLLQSLNGPVGGPNIVVESFRDPQKRLVGTLVAVHVHEQVARADWRYDARDGRWLEFSRQREVLGRSDLAGMVRCIAAEENIGWRRCSGSCQTTHVTYHVAGAVEEIEATIAKEIVCSEAPDFEALVEFDLGQLAAFKVMREHVRLLVLGIRREKGFLEPFADYKFRACGKRGKITNVVKVLFFVRDVLVHRDDLVVAHTRHRKTHGMTPDDGVNRTILDVDVVFLENLGNILFNVED